MAEERRRRKRCGAFQRRRAPALPVPGIADDRRQPRRQHVDGDAGHDLVAALGDARRSRAPAQARRTRRCRPAARSRPSRTRGLPRQPRRPRPASCPRARYRRRRRAPTTGRRGRRPGSGIDKPERGIEDGDDGAEIHAQAPAGAERREHARDQDASEQPVERAREQDDDAADHHDHVAGDGGLLEGEFRAALVEHRRTAATPARCRPDARAPSARPRCRRSRSRR